MNILHQNQIGDSSRPIVLRADNLCCLRDHDRSSENSPYENLSRNVEPPPHPQHESPIASKEIRKKKKMFFRQNINHNFYSKKSCRVQPTTPSPRGRSSRFSCKEVPKLLIWSLFLYLNVTFVATPLLPEKQLQ